MSDFLHQAITVDTYTLVVVALLSGWGGVLTMQVLSRTMLALIFVPGLVFGALTANYLFNAYHFYPTPDREVNVVIACTLGLIAALLVLLVSLRLMAIVSTLFLQNYAFKSDMVQAPSPYGRQIRRV
ncbi:hypothetical protein [Hyphomicrobium sulfonivorans]|uniref:hypothetical protein n=1 Tax=Hyphomicrobium sulfonivorans TaxID=121290 RepID=UPI001570DE10|nr:hypothetical protein [Hyphomicrobium sulfonivorans]MBI1648732.1 hypothetical protein [Hyphomicrobium sulfonivorans]NSL70733.1 hypothetical protein [Hyphomicrobium sulfonivorans]